MIDFRYHLVSIIAVFLALAVGLLVGSTALSGKNLEVLNSAQRAAISRNDTLTKDNGALSQQIGADEAFAQANAQRLLAGQLTDQDVILVLAPGANGTLVSGVSKALQQAGATVTGQVQLNQAFVATTGQNESALTSLAQRLAPSAGVTLSAQSGDPAVAGQQAAAAVLASAILNKDGSGLANAVSQQIFNGFGQGNFLSVGNLPKGATTPGSATLAVLVTPDGAPQTSNADASKVYVAVAQELRAAGEGTVMAGSVSAIGSGSAIGAENGAGQASTVDNADTESGQIMVVQALRNLVDGKKPTAYGISPKTAPAPAPSLSPSSSPSPSTSTGGRR
ncbi:MAG TPA: copper transporter [Streptosporangiaceae bacterium]